jgi:hypothetical protein
MAVICQGTASVVPEVVSLKPGFSRPWDADSLSTAGNKTEAPDEKPGRIWKDKVVIVTGTSCGLGKAAALHSHGGCYANY